MALVPVLLGAVSSIGSAHPKDADRIGKNTIAAGLASAGDDNALAWLKARSISGYSGAHLKYDAKYMGPLGSSDPNDVRPEGWATATARQDAAKKYDAALKARQQIGQAITGVGVGVGIGSEGATTGSFLGSLGVPGSGTTWAIVILLLLALAWFFMRSK